MFDKTIANRMMGIARSLMIVAMILLGGCLGTIVGTTADVAIEVAKVPFKVGGAVVDVATGDDEDEED